MLWASRERLMQSSGISFQEQFPIARLVTHVELGSLGGITSELPVIHSPSAP